MKLRKETAVYPLIYVLFGLFYLWLASCVPYTHDDWDWGLSNGITQLLTASINSRYAGNFFVVVMTRSQVLKTVLMAATCFLVPFGIAKIAAKEAGETRKCDQLLYFLLANFLILTMDAETWRETYGWVSGFANYVISTLFLLINLGELLRVAEESYDWERDTVAKAAVLGCTGFLGQLFLENLAIYMVALTAAVGFFYYRKYRRIPKRVWFLAAGAVLGLVVMFSSSIYATLWQTGSAVGGVRKLSFRTGTGLLGSIKGLVLQTAGLVRRGAEKQCLISCTVLLLLSWGMTGKDVPGKGYKMALTAANLVIAAYFCVVEIFDISYTGAGILISLVGAAANFLYFCLVTVEVFLVFWNHKAKLCRAAILWLSVILYLAPMVVTTVYGPRLYYVSNVFSILLICLLVRHIGLDAGKKRRAWLAGLLAAGIGVSMVHYGIVYRAIDQCNDQRIAMIAQAVSSGEKELVFPKYPYEEYLWMPDPISEEREQFYKEFYQIPADTRITFA